jgi:hypothetical protein
MKSETKRHFNVWLWLLGAALIATSGCSGINASKSISPLDFLLPGLHIQNTPPAPLVPESTDVMVA